MAIFQLNKTTQTKQTKIASQLGVTQGAISQATQNKRNIFVVEDDQGISAYEEKPVFNTNPDLFQSTHPCGVRHTMRFVIQSLLSFNPRTRVGCDAECLFCQSTQTGFNPRTRVGCDFSQCAAYAS